ncbi:DMT family transporter [Rhizobium sp. L1K21]|uniref:DMT family transporter n=1 Tax=Rhizobium sp. L1K21 TaxID=2954933 RepID=UPI002093FB10|nr:DMT family transporter [Rhizobium sp. L1K21]MCO6186990.1 DMT family transporter [Rhizobium sp. L1K21]
MTTSPTGGNLRRTENLRGVILMAMAFLSLSVCDMLAKLATSEFPPLQIAWTRQLALLTGVLIALSFRGPILLKTKNPGMQVARGALAVTSAVCFIFGVKYVPLADAVAVTFVAPFVVTAVSGLLLGEKVGPRRWTAVIFGFIGVLIILRPGFGTVHPAALLLVLAATAFAMRQVLSRRLAGVDKTGTTVAYTALVSVFLLSLPLAFVWQTPVKGEHILWLAGMTLAAAMGEMFLITALEIGEAAVLAPVQYSLIIWSTLWGWLVFGDLPDMWTGVGAAVIVATGLYIFQRERTVQRKKPRPEDINTSSM